MSDFDSGFDWEPEDSWDADDDPHDMARNLMMRLDLLDRSSGMRPIDTLIADIELRLGQYRRRREQLRPRDQLRLDQLTEDLPVLRERARHG
jgi:hypothetical protein